MKRIRGTIERPGPMMPFRLSVWISSMGIGAALLLAPLAAAAQSSPSATADWQAGSVSEILYARPFTLEEAYLYAYTAESETLSAGYLLVLTIDKELAAPRNAAMPVLFYGARPVEPLNFGHLSGRMVCLVPGDTDLEAGLAFFGSRGLPEQIDSTRSASERALAERDGTRPFPAEMIRAARQAGGDVLRAKSIDSVYRAGAELILRYAPEEREVAESYLLIPEEQ
jgi:hypothetical protein